MNVGHDREKLTKPDAYFVSSELPTHWDQKCGMLSNTYSFKKIHPRRGVELWTFCGTFKMPIMATYCIQPATPKKKAIYKTFYEGVWTYHGRMFRKGDTLVPLDVESIILTHNGSEDSEGSLAALA